MGAGGEKQRFFSHSPRAKIFLSGKSKNKIFFSKQHICSKFILLDLYVRVFHHQMVHVRFSRLKTSRLPHVV